jgi:cell division protein FtsW (lipid II flippase)
VCVPLPALAVGLWVAHAHGVSPVAFAPNLCAALLGTLAAAALSRRSRASLLRAAPWLALASLVALTLTLLAPAAEAVHRWLPLGPLRLHASAAFTPWIVLGLAALLRAQRRPAALALALGTQAVHLLQPDAGQATAFGVSAAALLLAAPNRARLTTAFALVLMAAGAWCRPDPLPAVPHVEHIVQLAAACGPWFLAMAVLALACLVVPFARVAWQQQRAGDDTAALSFALALYGAATLAVPVSGRFPVPVMGAGAGPVLGVYTALGIVLGRSSRV